MGTNTHSKLNILELHSSLGYAGGQRNMVTFCSQLNRDVFSVFAGGYMSGGPQEARLEAMGVPTVVSEGNSETILSFIREHNIDILHIHRSGHHVPLESAIIDGAKEINPNLVVIEKNVFGKYDPVSDRTIDVSFFQSMMHIHERYVPASGKAFEAGRMKVLYNMVDRESFEQYSMSKEEIHTYKQSLGIASDDIVIGKIGRPHIAKWSDLILDMMPHLVRLVPNIKFLIQSIPESRKKSIAKSPWADRIIDLPQSADEHIVHRFYQTIDILAHSSKIGECNGNTINEAMYWKKPVVVNSTPKRDNGQLEQVIHMHNGIVANHPETFARAIAYLAINAEERTEMGQNGYKQVCSVNDPSRVTRMLERAIYDVLASRADARAEILKPSVEDVSYEPDEATIRAYKVEYRKRLGQSFDSLRVADRIRHILRSPQRLMRKIQDYIEANHA